MKFSIDTNFRKFVDGNGNERRASLCEPIQEAANEQGCIAALAEVMTGKTAGDEACTTFDGRFLKAIIVDGKLSISGTEIPDFFWSKEE